MKIYDCHYLYHHKHLLLKLSSYATFISIFHHLLLCLPHYCGLKVHLHHMMPSYHHCLLLLISAHRLQCFVASTRAPDSTLQPAVWCFENGGTGGAENQVFISIKLGSGVTWFAQPRFLVFSKLVFCW